MNDIDTGTSAEFMSRFRKLIGLCCIYTSIDESMVC